MTIGLNKVEQLIEECKELGINVIKHPLPDGIKGLYYDDIETESIITIAPNIETKSEACCVLAEELGHYHTSCGNLLSNDTDNTIIRQQETRAKRWAYKKLVPLNRLTDAYNSGVRDRYELAVYLDVTDEFLEVSLNYYKEKYGIYHILNNYIIYFDPFGIFKMFE